MKKTVLALLLGSLLFCFASSSPAQQKVYRIGSLNTTEQFLDSFEGFKARMAELGYHEGQKVRYDLYDAKGSDEVLNGFARRMVQDKVDLIVTSSTTATVAAAEATKGTNIPVVFLSAGNPQKLVKSFAGSGTNLAGISAATVEITGKRLELLRELAPWVKHIAALNDPGSVNFKANLNAAREEGKRQRLTFWEIEVRSREEIAKVAPTLTRKAVDAIYTPPDSTVTDSIDILVQQAIKERLPLMTSLRANVMRGCLATYAADYFALGRQGALIVDKIFKGIKPSDLPIELPSKFKLVINLKTARAVGLKIPRAVLVRADEVIE
ncbi:MAG: ABC transporter substrate-binding protein [Deltaproteobacteria bacterium]|nr:ABC transporter substrate-binding protein [Deltaproteobacteria bacterium]